MKKPSKEQIIKVIWAELNIYSCQDKANNIDDGLLGSIKDVILEEFCFNDKNKMILDYLDVEHLDFM